LKRTPRVPRGDASRPSKARKSDLAIPQAGLCNGTALRMATRRVSQLYDAIFAPCGLRSTQWSILAHIGRVEKQSIGEMANALVLDRSALAHNLKPLERDGLIQSVADENDKRARLVILTKAGRAKVEEATPLWERAQCQFERVFGAKKAKELRDSLEVISSEEFAQIFQRMEEPRAKGNRRRSQQTEARRTRSSTRPAQQQVPVSPRRSGC
jgi:DNA-binding MarR family transcriptional regulator